MSYAIYVLLSLLVLLGLSRLSKVKSAVSGNLMSLAAMIIAVFYILYEQSSLSDIGVWIALLAGTIAGLYWAKIVRMIEMPQTVGLLNGIGGLASAMVGALELLKSGSTVFGNVTAAVALAVGAVTFTGSVIAAAKLARKIDSRPRVYRNHGLYTIVLLVMMLAGVVMSAVKGLNTAACIVTGLSSLAFGYIFAIRVGGADMPVAISLLNSFSGVAGAIAGMAIYNLLLVSIGGIVGSSGLLLTQIMCRAMNRKLVDILVGKSVKPAAAKSAEPAEKKQEEKKPSAEEKSEPAGEMTLAEAKNVIIVPGYGMALSQAQHKVKELTAKLEANGAQVRFAIHPVAGRMPGHMNVLLAEADVDYDHLYELDAINDDFKDTDAVVVIGASDVMNPAAREAEGTPIYGMPVLNVDQAPRIFICNFDLKPGYAGVENPIYSRKEGVRLLLGDAKDSLDKLISEI